VPSFDEGATDRAFATGLLAEMLVRPWRGSEPLASWRGDDDEVLLLGGLGPEVLAGVDQSTADPAGVLTAGGARVAMLELERHRLQPRGSVGIEIDEIEKPQVVAQLASTV
jgi:hypothetical protein